MVLEFDNLQLPGQLLEEFIDIRTPLVTNPLEEKHATAVNELTDFLEKAGENALLWISESSSLAKKFSKLPETIQKKLALIGNLKNKNSDVLEFLSKIKVNQKHPKAFELFDRKGAALHLLGKYLEAIEVYNDALAINKNIPAFLFRRAEAKYKLELFISAQADYEEAIEMDDKNPSYGKLKPEEIQNIKLSINKCREVEEEYLKVLKSDPNHYDSRCRIATIYTEHTDSEKYLKKGIEHLKTAVSLEPKKNKANFLLAKAYFKLSCSIGGDTTLMIDPETIDDMHLARIHEKKSGRIIKYSNKAIGIIDWLLIKGYENAEYHLLKSKCLKINGDNTTLEKKTNLSGQYLAKAAKTLETLAIEPTRFSSELYKLLPLVLNYNTLDSQAKKAHYSSITNQFKELFQNNRLFNSEQRRKLYSSCANFCMSAGNYKFAVSAIRFLETAEKNNGIDSKSYCEQIIQEFLPDIMEKAKENLEDPAVPFYSEALSSAKKAASLLPQPDAYLQLVSSAMCLKNCLKGEAKETLGKELDENATEIISDVSRFKNDSPEYLFLLCEILASKNKYKEALYYIEQILKQGNTKSLYVTKRDQYKKQFHLENSTSINEV